MWHHYSSIKMGNTRISGIPSTGKDAETLDHSDIAGMDENRLVVT